MSWPLSSLVVHAFRGLRDVKLQDLGRINLLVGGTNSGKTTILEALSLLAQPLDPMVWFQAANRREPSPLAAMASSKGDRLRYLFPVDAADHERRHGVVRLDFAGTAEVKGLDAELRQLQGLRPTPELVEREDGGSDAVVTEVERGGLEVTVSLDLPQLPLARELRPRCSFQVWEGEPFVSAERPTGPRVPLRVVTPYEHWLRQPATRGFSEAVLSGHERDTLELLRRIEPTIRGARVLTTQREPTLYLEDARSGYLPLSAFGDGIRRVLTLALALPRAAGGLLLIDEVETGLHVSMLGPVYAWIVRACEELNIQLFATTHSLEALDALLDADVSGEEDTAGFRLERDGGASTVKRFGEKQLRRLRHERGLDVR